MANELLNLAWPLQLESSGEKFVLVTLADAANADGWCSMCADTIAYRTGLHARTVKTILSSICKKGLIFINERRGRSSEFVVNKVALEVWQKAATWLKNQQLKTERIDKLTAQVQAAAPATPATPATPAIPAPAAKSAQAATNDVLLEREQHLKKAVPVPEALRERLAKARAAFMASD